MAENKKSFILYADLIATVEKLPDVKAGKLLKTILAYVNDQNPVVDDLVLQIAFEPIKLQLKRDLRKWEAEREKKSVNGKLGGLRSGEARRSKSKQKEAKGSSASKNEANEAVTVTVNVTDTVSERESAPPAYGEEVKYSVEHCLTVAMNHEQWVRDAKVTKEKLLLFNQHLKERGEYEKNPKDYKKHYASWIKKVPIDSGKASSSNASNHREEEGRNQMKALYGTD